MRNLKADQLYSDAPAFENPGTDLPAQPKKAQPEKAEPERAEPARAEPARADLAVMDVSFISVTKTLPALFQLLNPQAFEMIVLIKPQFEAGRENVGKGGVVRDANVHKDVVDKVIRFVLTVRSVRLGLTHSPIKGPQGNIEYLLYLKGGSSVVTDPDLDTTSLAKSKVEEAFNTLGAP